MKKLLLCLTAVICFSLLNVATADSASDCKRLTKPGLINPQYREALPLCQEACNLNDSEGCFMVGYLYHAGTDIRQNFQQAKIYYEKACNLNHMEGCHNLGLLYRDGQGVRQNLQTAKEYFGKACDVGLQEGCNKYRMLNEKGY